MQNLINKLISGQNLTQKESEVIIKSMIDSSISPIQSAGILTALRMKGETTDEILGFIKVLRESMLKVMVNGIVIDTCGTGGDGQGVFNVSTTVALVVAGMNVKVAKHGNRSASSLCGSADVLQALGVNIDLNPVDASKVLEKAGIVFLFAPLFHPAFKNIIPVRRELGIRTVFNFLGPFLNPASVKRQIIGVPNPALAQKLAKVAKKLNYEHLILVSSEDLLDEISISEKTQIIEIKKNRTRIYQIQPEDYDIKKVSLQNVQGGDSKRNAQIIKEILNGVKGPKRDIVVLNSAFAFLVSGNVKNIKEGIKLAEKSIDEGKAKKVLEKLVIISNKYAKHT